MRAPSGAGLDAGLWHLQPRKLQVEPGGPAHRAVQRPLPAPAWSLPAFRMDRSDQHRGRERKGCRDGPRAALGPQRRVALLTCSQVMGRLFHTI